MRNWKYLIATGMLLLLGACSSSKTNTSDTEDAIPPPSDAQTDAVPQESPEQKQQAAVDPAPVAPAPSRQEPESNTGAATGGTYTTQVGDTLMKIAFENYGDLYRWKDIYEANKDKIQNPNSIPKGIVLRVDSPATPVSIDRNGEKYLIKSGDTLGTISTDVYGTKTKWKKIWVNNKQLIKDPNKIFAGFFLYYVPEQKETNPQPMAGTESPGSRAPSSAQKK